MSERIQKYLARLGYGSRRQIEKWVGEGLIVDAMGRPYKVGQRVIPTDKLFISGVEVVFDYGEDSPTRVLAYHKVAGEVSTLSDPQGRPTIYDRLPQDLIVGKWVSVGRLDINTTGLILFSNDGHLVHGLTHPSREVHRQYRCRVWGGCNSDQVEQITQGGSIKK